MTSSNTVRKTSYRSLFREPLRAISALLFLTAASVLANAQNSSQNIPLLSGGIGFFHGTNAGNIAFQPVLSPVAAVPLGQHVLVESRAYISDFIAPQNGNSGPYQTSFFAGLTYLTADYIASPKLTITAGEFLTPFGTFNERLNPIWINNFQDDPLIFGIGTNGGSGLGGTLRGVAYSNSKLQLNYVAYFSAASTNTQFSGTREAGGQFSMYIPDKRLEIGASYNRILQGQQSNPVGAHVWWQSKSVPLQIRSEYAHNPHAQGYWVETAYRLSQWSGPGSWLGRLEPVFRMQQTFRQSPGPANGVPAVNAQRADFALDYHLPHEVRINTSYSRQFESTGNFNIWETSLIYRFLFPAWKGGSK